VHFNWEKEDHSSGSARATDERQLSSTSVPAMAMGDLHDAEIKRLAALPRLHQVI
jgi:hypothetical protein